MKSGFGGSISCVLLTCLTCRQMVNLVFLPSNASSHVYHARKGAPNLHIGFENDSSGMWIRS